MGKNYIVKQGTWQPLSDVMNQDYDHNANYAIHVNEIYSGFLRVEYTKGVPTKNDKGREIPQMSVLYCGQDVGDDIYLMGSGSEVNINVFEVE